MSKPILIDELTMNEMTKIDKSKPQGLKKNLESSQRLPAMELGNTENFLA